MATKIEVEWIAQSQSMTQALERMNAKLDAQDKKLEKIGKTSQQAATLAAGSFAKLEKELKDAEKALRGMAAGSSEFAKQKVEVDRLRMAVASANASMDQSRSVIGRAGAAAIGQIGQMVVGLASLQTIVSTVVNELEHAKALNIAAAQAQMSVEQAVAKMAINVGPENVVGARDIIDTQAAGLGVSKEGLANLLAAAISAGATDLNDAMKAIVPVLKVTAGNAEEAQPILSGLLTLASQSGMKDYEASIGQFSQFQKAARGEDAAQSINNMNAALASGTSAGANLQADTTEQVLERAAAISQKLQDPTMAVTGTTVRQLYSKLDSFVAKTTGTADDGSKIRTSRENADAINAARTVDQKIEMMRTDPSLAKQFLSTIEDNQGKPAIRDIVTGTDQMMALERAAKETILPTADAKVDFLKLADAIANQTQVLDVENRSRANIQASQTSGDAGLRGEVEKIVSDTLENTNLSGIDALRKIEAWTEMQTLQGQGVSPAVAGEQVLRARMRQETMLGMFPIGGELSPQAVDLFERQIAELQKLNQRMAQQQQPARAARDVRPQSAPLPSTTVP